MRKIKFKLSHDEMKSLMLIIELSCQGQLSGIENVAAKEILMKLFIKIFQRIPVLKKTDNSLILTIPELWAIDLLAGKISHRIGPYEKVLLGRIIGETNRLTA